MSKTKLPVGLTEFEAFVDTLLEAGTLATKDRESVRFVVASGILNLGHEADAVEEGYFERLINAASAKQIAAHVFHEIKAKQKELEQKAREDAAKEAEAAKDVAPSDVPTQQ